MECREVEWLQLPAKKEVVVHRQPNRRWKVQALLPLVALVAGSLLLAGCGQSAASSSCTTKQLIEAAGSGYLKLPPTHDNDAGKGRIPDTRPDADIDANQRNALCAVYRSEKHLPG